jgi:hypothetical protein
MNSNCAGSRAKVSLGLGFKNPTKEDSDLKSATPKIVLAEKPLIAGRNGQYRLVYRHY